MQSPSEPYLLDQTIKRYHNWMLFKLGFDNKLDTNISIENILSDFSDYPQTYPKDDPIIWIKKIIDSKRLKWGDDIFISLFRNETKGPEIIEFLLKEGVLNEIPNHFRSITQAVMTNNKTAFDLLIKFGALIDQNNDNSSRGIYLPPLAYLIYMGEVVHQEYKFFIQKLIKAGAQWEEPLQKAMDLAIDCKNNRAIERIQKWQSILETKNLLTNLPKSESQIKKMRL